MGDDISQVETGQLTKQVVNGHVLVPMLEKDENALQLSHDDHDLSQPYADSGKTTFKWPANKTLEDFFPNLSGDQIVVLPFLPNVILFGFGTDLVKGQLLTEETSFPGWAMDQSCAPIWHPSTQQSSC